MTPTPSERQSLFEKEMRAQVASAEAAVLEAMASEDPIVVEVARGHLDGLVALARRNGLEITPNVPAEQEVSIAEIDVADEEAKSA